MEDLQDQVDRYIQARDKLNEDIAELQRQIALATPPWNPGDKLAYVGMFVTVLQVQFVFDRWLCLISYDRHPELQDGIAMSSELKVRVE